MKITKWIESLYKPEDTNLREGALEDLVLALNDQGVRTHWINAMIDELRAINVGVDRSLADGNFSDLESRSARRKAIVFCMNQILDSKQALDTERFEVQRENQVFKPSPFEGVAVQRD